MRGEKPDHPELLFISHSTSDRDFVEQNLIPPLETHGVKTWYSADDIPTASKWEKEIRKALERCDWFLVVLSESAIKSPWVEAEVHWAMNERREHIVPIIVDDCRPAELHLQLMQIQFVDFRGDLDNARSKLLSTWKSPKPYSRSPHELRLVQGPPELYGTAYPITGKHMLGRNPGPGGIQVDDPFMSGEHTMFLLSKGAVFAQDLSAVNGTFVNGNLIQPLSLHQLHDGDEVRVGGVLLIYRHFSETNNAKSS